MWRRSDCFRTDSDHSCFDCKEYDEHVENCSSRLVLRDDIVTCASTFSHSSVFDNCDDHASTTGECGEFGEEQKQKFTHEAIIKNLCKVDKKAVELTGIQCPSSQKT